MLISLYSQQALTDVNFAEYDEKLGAISYVIINPSLDTTLEAGDIVCVIDIFSIILNWLDLGSIELVEISNLELQNEPEIIRVTDMS